MKRTSVNEIVGRLYEVRYTTERSDTVFTMSYTADYIRYSQEEIAEDILAIFKEYWKEMGYKAMAIVPMYLPTILGEGLYYGDPIWTRDEA